MIELRAIRFRSLKRVFRFWGFTMKPSTRAFMIKESAFRSRALVESV